MKVTFFGTGYVGLVSGACLAEMGNDVLCFDIDTAKIQTLECGGMPIHEPGLAPLIAANRQAGRLAFTTDLDRAVAHGELIFIAVGTPPDEDGAADLRHVLAAARSIGERMTGYKLIVDKSTVPVGTAELVRKTIDRELASRECDAAFSVVSNPEFLKEGAAVEDFMRPDRIVVGASDVRAVDLMRELYAPYLRNHDRLLVMDVRSAELTKYAANAMLATRISFMNELANLAEVMGADIEAVRTGIGSDSRIGYSFLYAGCGYGGSCFPKDVKALIQAGSEHGNSLRILKAVEATNEAQKEILAGKILARFGEDLSNRKFAIWGLAFKPNTDDMRQAPSRTLIDRLLRHGASLAVYDPIAMGEARRIYAAQPRVTFSQRSLGACDGADALLILTEWREFRAPDFVGIRSRLRTPLVVDGRNLYDPALPQAAGLEYLAIGRSPRVPLRQDVSGTV